MDKTPGNEPTTLGDLSDKTLDKVFQDKNFLKRIEPYTPPAAAGFSISMSWFCRDSSMS